MAQYTPNLGLIKPAGNDNVAVQQLNANMDVLDEVVHGNTEKIDRIRIMYPPYIDESTGHWMIYDPEAGDYADSGYSAIGRPATFTARATTLPAGSDATASIGGTALNPIINVGIPKGDKGAKGNTGSAAGFGTPTASVDANVGTPSVKVTASGPNTAKVFNFVFKNLKGQKGDTGGVSSVNGKTGPVQLNDEDIPSTIDGKANVEAVLSYHSQQIEDLQAADAYIEEGDTAQLRTYVAGDFIMWKGELYTVNSEGIAQGTAIAGHVTIVDEGGFNKLLSKITPLASIKQFTVSGTTDAQGLLYLSSIPFPYIPIFIGSGTGYICSFFNGAPGSWQPYVRFYNYDGSPLANRQFNIVVYCIGGTINS